MAEASGRERNFNEITWSPNAKVLLMSLSPNGYLKLWKRLIKCGIREIYSSLQAELLGEIIHKYVHGYTFVLV